MKQRFKVDVMETYRKTVDVIAENEEYAAEEARNMQQAGEIEWDCDDDYNGFEVLGMRRDTLLESEKEYVQKWAMNTVKMLALLDPEWILEEMTRDECMDWIECMRDKGIDVPVLATSNDLWNAVQKERGCK